MTAEFSNKPYKSPSLKKTTCYRLLTGLNISPRCPSHSNNMLKRKINMKFIPRVLNFKWVHIKKKNNFDMKGFTGQTSSQCIDTL